MKKNKLKDFSGNQDILISTKPRPIWHKVLAALLYTAMAAFLFIGFTNFDINTASKSLMLFGRSFEISSALFVFAIKYSMVKDFYFDLKNKRYKIVKRVGLVEFGRWKEFRNLGYVSVFKNGKGIIEINLWYHKNKHFNMGQGKTLAAALTAGKKIAEKLQIELLDAATDPRNSKWVPVP